MRKQREYEIIQESSYQKGLAIQRERFKQGKDGSGQNNYDQMCDAIENLKSDLKSKILKRGSKDKLKRIEAVVNWFRTLEIKYTRQGPEGTIISFPANIEQKINKNLTVCYEILISEMELLNLL